MRSTNSDISLSFWRYLSEWIDQLLRFGKSYGHLSEMTTVTAVKGESYSRNNSDPSYKFKKSTKSAIQLELDVNGLDDEDFFHVNDIDRYQPAKTPSVLCSQTHFRLENWLPQTIFTVVENVLNRCREVSYEYIETDFKVTRSALKHPLISVGTSKLTSKRACWDSTHLIFHY